MSVVSPTQNRGGGDPFIPVRQSVQVPIGSEVQRTAHLQGAGSPFELGDSLDNTKIEGASFWNSANSTGGAANATDAANGEVTAAAPGKSMKVEFGISITETGTGSTMVTAQLRAGPPGGGLAETVAIQDFPMTINGNATNMVRQITGKVVDPFPGSNVYSLWIQQDDEDAEIEVTSGWLSSESIGLVETVVGEQTLDVEDECEASAVFVSPENGAPGQLSPPGAFAQPGDLVTVDVEFESAIVLSEWTFDIGTVAFVDAPAFVGVGDTSVRFSYLHPAIGPMQDPFVILTLTKGTACRRGYPLTEQG